MWSPPEITNPLPRRSQRKPGSAASRVSVLMLLCLTTILFFQFYPRYKVNGPELLADPTFQDNLQHWSPSGPGVSVLAPGLGVALLRSTDPSRNIRLSQDILPAQAYPLLQLACDIKTTDVARDANRRHNENYYAARVLLTAYGQDDKPIYDLPHGLALLLGSNDWQHHEGVFFVHPGTARLSVVAQLLQVSGAMWVKNLSLRPVAEAAAFGKFHTVAILLWVAVAAWIVLPLARSLRNHGQWRAILALGLVITVGVLMPEGLKEQLTHARWPSLTNTIFPAPDPVSFRFSPLLVALDLSKAGHFVLFAMLAAVALFRRPYPISRLGMAGYLLLFALATEVAQLLVAGRSAQLGDLLIDAAGMITGVGLMHLVSWRRNRRKQGLEI